MNTTIQNGMPALYPGQPQDQFLNQGMTALNQSNWPPINQTNPYPHQPHNHHWQQQQQQQMQNGHHTVPQPTINVSAPVTTAQHAFPNPFDIASVLPQQFVQDYLRPVGQFPNDDVILSQALFDSKQSGRTYRQALEALHGVRVNFIK